MGKLSARSQSGTLTVDSEVHAVNDPSGTPVSSKETVETFRTAMAIGARTDLSGGTALSLNIPYFDAISAPVTYTFSGTPGEGDRLSLTLTVTSGPHVLTIPTSSRANTTGTTTTVTLNDGTQILNWIYTDGAYVLTDTGAVTQTESWSGLFRTGDDDTVTLIQNVPFAGTIVNTTTICASGTATYTFKISTTSLGGTANAVTSSQDENAHASANVFAAGDDIQLTRSADSTCVDANFTIEYTREV